MSFNFFFPKFDADEIIRHILTSALKLLEWISTWFIFRLRGIQRAFHCFRHKEAEWDWLAHVAIERHLEFSYQLPVADRRSHCKSGRQEKCFSDLWGCGNCDETYKLTYDRNYFNDTQYFSSFEINQERAPSRFSEFAPINRNKELWVVRI